MIHLRYPEGDWRFDSASKTLQFCTGEHVLLCSELKPYAGARPIVRKGESEWVVAPVVFFNHGFRKIPDADFILLTGTPEPINHALASLL